MIKYIIFAIGVGIAKASASEIPIAYRSYAASEGIPASVLWAIARIESNAELNIGWYPWPWTLNIAGEGHYFPDRESACSKAIAAIEEHGAKSVDIGFTQINWGWNGKEYFSSPCDALEPARNLQVAAKILRKCFDTRKDWIEAAGCYHRPAGGPTAKIYSIKFAKRWDGTE